MEVPRTDYPLFSLPQPALQVSFLSSDYPKNTMKEVSLLMNELPRQSIECCPWPTFPYRPDVTFSIAYDATCIYLKYYVTEETIQARYNKPNDPVYKDSCVEFFISFGDDVNYYNLEFNSLGTCRAGYGPNQVNRALLPPERIHLIRRDVVFISPSSYNSFKNYHWQLTLAIPVQVFGQHVISSLRGCVARANFYKCGDELPKPHYLAWKTIHAPAPNFHLPEFFGNLRFV